MKKYLSIFLVLLMLLTLTACGPDETEAGSPSPTESLALTKDLDTDTEWVIYWYLCGSDLETNHAAATNDLAELLDVKLPENVKVVIETGGSSVWQNDIISADKLGRYLYDHNGLQLIKELPLANMVKHKRSRIFLPSARKIILENALL